MLGVVDDRLEVVVRDDRERVDRFDASAHSVRKAKPAADRLLDESL